MFGSIRRETWMKTKEDKEDIEVLVNLSVTSWKSKPSLISEMDEKIN